MNRSLPLLIVGAALIGLGILAWFTLSGSSDDPIPLPPKDAQASAPVISAAYERTLGSPKAPITMIEYAAPMCPVCARFDMNEFPKLKAQYINTGKVFYIFRVFPIGNPDYGAEALARCLPKERYFDFIDMLYRNQEKWDPDGHQIPDVRGALLAMAGVAGLPADKAAACINDQTVIANTTTIAQDASSRFSVHGTPTFVVDGTPVFSGEYPWDQLKAMLDARLAR